MSKSVNKCRLISGHAYPLTSIFRGDNEKVVIPDLQRDYCWGNPENNLVNSFMDTLIGLDKKSPLTMGIIYGYTDSLTGHIQICDGQQRLTTLFLIIGVLNRLLPGNQFQRILISDFEYYNDDQEPYLQYAIRESSLYFLSDLTCNYFLGKTGDDITVQPWFLNSYKLDPTINSILNAIKTIKDKLDGLNIDDLQELAEYVTTKLKFLYLDMNNRISGEETFVIINTTGEPLSPVQNLKPLVIKENRDACPSVASDWEELETWFWRKREIAKQHDTSDEGMSAFLRCVQLLHVFDTNGRIESLDDGRTIFPYKEISFQAIYDCFKAYKRLYILDYSGRKDLSYKYTEFTQQNLFVILPVLYYCRRFPDSSDVDIQRVWHLFFNIKRYADLSRPVEPINKAIRVVSEMGTKDVLCLKDNDTLGDISNQDEERPKLRMISSNDEINRTRIELVLSDAESQELFNGRISVLLKWANNNIDFVESYLDRIKLLWVESTETDRDILRSALLARGISNYPLPQGSHQSLGYSWKQWFEIISKNEDSIKAFLDDNRTLNSMIMDFGDTTSPFYSIIKNPTLLSSSYYKNVRQCENKILILLEKERASADFSILWDNIQYQKYELGGNWEYLWEYAGLLFSDHREYNLTIDFFKTDSGYKTQIWRGKYPNKKAFIFLHEMASVLSLKSVEGKGLECWETEPMPPEKAKETMRKIASWVTGKEVE